MTGRNILPAYVAPRAIGLWFRYCITIPITKITKNSYTENIATILNISYIIFFFYFFLVSGVFFNLHRAAYFIISSNRYNENLYVVKCSNIYVGLFLWTPTKNRQIGKVGKPYIFWKGMSMRVKWTIYAVPKFWIGAKIQNSKFPKFDVLAERWPL